MNEKKVKKTPSFLVSISPIILMAVVMGVGFGIYRYSIEVLLLVVSFATIALAYFYGADWDTITAAVTEKVSKSFMVIFIFVFVGLIIGTWMLCGTIPMLIYYGLKLISPSMFLVSAFLVTSIVSICTGTSFGSAGTVGLALIGVAQGLGVHPAAAAGAIVSGAYFGDKMSPLSDSSNLAAVASGTSLMAHIKHNFITSAPAAIIACVVYFIAGQSGMVVGNVSTSAATDMMNELGGMFHFNILLLAPMLVVLIGSAMGKPTIPIMFIACVTAAILAVIFQGATIGSIITAGFSGFTTSMLPGVDPDLISESARALLERGGMTSMMTTVLKVLCTFLFGGAMTAGGFMDVILNEVRKFVRSDGTLVLITVITTIIITMVIGNIYVPMLLCGEIFQKMYQERNLDPRNLSMILGDACCVVVPLVPWSAGGSYMSGALGVATMEYLPWAVFNYIGFILAIIYGFTGFGLIRLKPGEGKEKAETV